MSLPNDKAICHWRTCSRSLLKSIAQHVTKALILAMQLLVICREILRATKEYIIAESNTNVLSHKVTIHFMANYLVYDAALIPLCLLPIFVYTSICSIHIIWEKLISAKTSEKFVESVSNKQSPRNHPLRPQIEREEVKSVNVLTNRCPEACINNWQNQ